MRNSMAFVACFVPNSAPMNANFRQSPVQKRASCPLKTIRIRDRRFPYCLPWPFCAPPPSPNTLHLARRSLAAAPEWWSTPYESSPFENVHEIQDSALQHNIRLAAAIMHNGATSTEELPAIGGMSLEGLQSSAGAVNNEQEPKETVKSNAKNVEKKKEASQARLEWECKWLTSPEKKSEQARKAAGSQESLGKRLHDPLHSGTPSFGSAPA